MVLRSVASRLALGVLVGSAIVLIPAVLYLMFEGRWGAAIFLGVWSAGVGVMDNFLRPYLTAKQAEVSTLAVFVGADRDDEYFKRPQGVVFELGNLLRQQRPGCTNRHSRAIQSREQSIESLES